MAEPSPSKAAELTDPPVLSFTKGKYFWHDEDMDPGTLRLLETALVSTVEMVKMVRTRTYQDYYQAILPLWFPKDGRDQVRDDLLDLLSIKPGKPKSTLMDKVGISVKGTKEDCDEHNFAYTKNYRDGTAIIYFCPKGLALPKLIKLNCEIVGDRVSYALVSLEAHFALQLMWVLS